MNRDYITSERFIHDSLIVQAAEGISSLYDSWKEKGSIDPFLLTWPAENVVDDDGNIVTDVCRLELPKEKNRWPSLFRQAISITKAYALLLVEQRSEDVRIILESPHGTRCWKVPIENHGGVKVLGKSSHTDNVESVGLLWRSNRAMA